MTEPGFLDAHFVALRIGHLISAGVQVKYLP